MGHEMREFRAMFLPPPFQEAFPHEDWMSSELPLDLEIGAGTGKFAIRYCQEHPDRRLIAIERTRTRSSRFEQSSPLSLRPKNLYYVRDEAERWVVRFLPPASLSRIFLLYPNPYPKFSQRNKRWHFSPFFQFLLSRLKEFGEIVLATNLQWYLTEAAESWTKTFDLKIVEQGEIGNFRTYTGFEEKYLMRGESCVYGRFQKISSPER